MRACLIRYGGVFDLQKTTAWLLWLAWGELTCAATAAVFRNRGVLLVTSVPVGGTVQAWQIHWKLLLDEV
jgi:hypothetical protein